MDDTFLQDEGPTFNRATLEIKSETSEFPNSRNVKDGKDVSNGTSTGPGISVPGIPYARIDCHTFFSDRNEVVERALADCQRDLLSSAEEDELVGTWLLTEISIWDTEKERLLLLTKNSLYSVKYDLISLKILEYSRVSLLDVDTLIAGELIYPPTSLLPRLNGLAEGVSSLIHSVVRQEWSSFTSLSSTAHFEPRSRNMFGIRLMWNKGQPLSVDKKWNPFAKDIPWLTFTSHPLYWHKGSDSDKTKYDVHALHAALKDLLSENCQKIESPIVIENYVGVGSLLHNRSGLGFFKIRGKKKAVIMFFNNDLKSEAKMNVFMFQQQAVFISGFIVGFIIFFLSEYTGSFFESSVLPNEHSSKAEQYEEWRQNQNAGISKLNQDAYIYGVLYSKNSNKLKLEAEWLKSKVPITCVVFVEKLKLAAAIKDTWGKQCNQILFFSQHLIDADLSVINLGIKFTSSWQLLCETMNYLWERKNKISLKWVIFIKDDTFVIPENLRHMLAPLNFKEPYYLGHAVILWGQPYNVAQAGYVLSYEVLRKLVNMFDTSKKCAAGGKYWKKEDYYLGKHLATLGIQPLDTRDLKQEGIFHGYPLNTLLWGVAKPGNYYTRALYPLGPECCSNKSITFNIGDPHKMRTFNYLLYHLRIFEGGIYGNRPAPTPIPENEVWRVALREEFNLTDLKDISSEQYFQIWRTKYSEPELFIAKNFQRKSGILKPVIEVYDTESEIRNESP